MFDREAAHRWADDVAHSLDGRTPYTRAELTLVLGRLGAWAAARAGLTIDTETLLRREVVSRFIDHGCAEWSEPVRANMRSQLLRAAEALLDPRRAPVRLTSLRAADPSQPYSDHEVTELISWTRAQSTPAREANARTLIALGLGAGLSAAEIGSVRAADLREIDGELTVTVTEGRSREVPVLARWQAWLRERSAELDAASFVFRPGHTAFYPNLITNFIDRSRPTGARPQTQRLRATWVVGHLSNGTPIGALVRAAGVDSLEAFSRYLEFVTRLPQAAERHALARPRETS